MADDPVLSDQQAGVLAAKFGILPAEDFKQIAAQYGIEPSSINTDTLKGISTTFDSGTTVQGTESNSMRAIRQLDEYVTKNVPGAAPSPFLHPGGAPKAESIDSGTVVARAQPPAPAGDRYSTSNNAYRFPEGATDVAGINRNVWQNVMSEEGPEFGADGKHPSVFGLWADASGAAERSAYQAVKQYGPHSVEAYNAVTGAWTKQFLQQSQPWNLKSPGLQELVIADSQHQGGGAARKIIDSMGGFDAVNQMDPAKAISTYSDLRKGLWPGNNRPFPDGATDRVTREKAWALSHANGIGQPAGDGQSPQTVAAPGDTVGPAAPVYIQPLDRSKIKTPTGRNDLSADEVSNYARAQADDYATTLAKAGTPLTVGEYKQQLSNFYLAAQKQNLGIQPERLPVDQGDALASLHQGIDLIDQISEKQKILADKYGTLYGTGISLPLTQTDEYKDFDAARQLAISTLARGVGGQKGTLSDSDVKIMKDALPNEHDTPAQAASKSAILKNMSLTMMRDKLAYLQANHYDVTDMARLYLGAQQKFDATRPDKSLDAQQNANVRQSYLDKAAAKVKPAPIQQPQQSSSPPSPSSLPSPSPSQPQPQPALEPEYAGIMGN